MQPTKPREVCMPDIEKWSDLFEITEAWNGSYAGRIPKPHVPSFTPARIRNTATKLGPYCGVDSPDARYALSVKPSARVQDYCNRLCFESCGDLSFKAVVRADDTALVIATYTRILGDHWLALIPASEVPAAPEGG